jgi:energy-coupling factor transport system substrate-specific component
VLASSLGLLAFGWPLLVDADAALARSTDGPWLFAVVVPLLLAVVVAELADGGMDAKAVALLGVLTAAGAALRAFSGGVTGFQPLFVVVILGGRVLGPGFGFTLGATSMGASALLTGGVGPWLPFQMLGAAWVGLGAGLLPSVRGRAELGLLAAYGAASGLAFGVLLNLWFWPFVAGADSAIAYVPGAPVVDNLGRLLAFSLATSLVFDLPRAVGNAVLIVVLGRPVLAALRRASTRAVFAEPVRFPDAPSGARTVAVTHPPAVAASGTAAEDDARMRHDQRTAP